MYYVPFGVKLERMFSLSRESMQVPFMWKRIAASIRMDAGNNSDAYAYYYIKVRCALNCLKYVRRVP